MSLKPVRVIENSLFGALLALVLVAPLPFGANRPWAWSLLAVLVGGLVVAWSLAVAAGRIRPALSPRHYLPALVPMALSFGWALIQGYAPVPADWTHPLWGEAERTLGEPLDGRISLSPASTGASLVRWLTWLAVFWLAAQLGRDRNRARWAVVSLAWGGVGYATYGLVLHFLAIERILWFDKWAYLGDLTSTFVNRNSYGAYAGIGLLCSLGLVAQAVRRRRQELHVREWTERVLLRAVAYSAAALILGFALLLSHSRGAFLGTLAGLLALLGALIAARMMRLKVGVAILIVLLCAIGVMFSIGDDGTARRLAESVEISPDESRPYLYLGAWAGIGDAPFLGTGVGAFLPTFNLYRDVQLWVPQIWDYAHNIYLEAVLGLGMPAASILLISIVWMGGTCLGGLRGRRRDHLFPALAVAVLVLAATHGAVDFSPQIPAVAMTLAFLTGIGYAQAWSSRELEP